MNEISVGKLLNIVYDTNKKTMRVLLEITDEIFKEQILRNNELREKITIKGDDVIWIAKLKSE